GKPDTGAEVEVVVVRDAAHVWIRERAIDRLEVKIRAALLDVRPADHVEVLVPAKAQAQRQAARRLPIILEIESKLLGSNIEEGIAVGDRHSRHRARRRKTVGKLSVL